MKRSVVSNSDLLKVQHVLRLLCEFSTDYFVITALFAKYDIKLIGATTVNRKWFAFFVSADEALRALNVVREKRFKLRKLNSNMIEVLRLKDIAPPPTHQISTKPDTLSVTKSVGTDLCDLCLTLSVHIKWSLNVLFVNLRAFDWFRFRIL